MARFFNEPIQRDVACGTDLLEQRRQMMSAWSDFVAGELLGVDARHELHSLRELTYLGKRALKFLMWRINWQD